MSEQNLKASVKQTNMMTQSPAKMVSKGEKIREHETNGSALTAAEHNQIKQEQLVNGDGDHKKLQPKKEPVQINGQINSPIKQKATKGKLTLETSNNI